MSNKRKSTVRKSTVRKSTAATQSHSNVDDVVLGGVLTALVKSHVKSWTGTMTELQTALVSVLGKKQSVVLPGSPAALRVVLNRVTNRLRTRGISVRFTRTPDHARTRFVKFSR
jgi:uncharacterized protein